MCSCSTKGRAGELSRQRKRQAEEEAAWTEIAEVTGKGNQLSHFTDRVLIAGAEIKILYTYIFSKIS